MYYEYVGEGAWPNSKLFKFFVVTYISCSDNLTGLPLVIIPVDPELRELRALIDADSIQPFLYNKVECNNRSNDQCFKKYSFSDTISLRYDFLPYQITTQTCCRVSTIDNLISPGMTGIITNVTVDQKIFNANNTSPKITNTALLSFCVGEPVDFKYNVSEADGDEVFFSLCAPLGRSPGFPVVLGSPYPTVQFLEPTYSAEFPLGQGNLTIDSSTGQLIGTPDLIGNFVLGICMEEYRDGVFLGRTLQDITLSVVACSPSFQAEIESTEIDDFGQNTYNLCNEYTLSFQNLSEPSESITDYKWFIDYLDQPRTSILENPIFTFDQSGTFHGHMVVNPDSLCSDTAFFVVEVSEITADFNWVNSSNDQFSPEIQFSDQSINAVAWEWNISSDPRTYFDDEFTYAFNSYGGQEVSLVVEDINGCKDTSNQTIEILYPSTYFLPNAFTPNGDGLNDEFVGVGITEAISDFKLEIFNRWGTLIFSISNPDIGWTGEDFSPGIYIYKVSFIQSNGKLFLNQGEVALVR